MASPTFQALLASASASVIGTPVSLGSAQGTASTNSMTITTTAASPNGALLFVVTHFHKATTISVSSISDGTNNYTLARSGGWDATNQENTELWYCANAAGMGSGATITITYSSTVSGTAGSVAAAGYCSGILASSPLDSVNSTLYAPGANFSSGATATLAQAKELIIGALGFYNTNAPLSSEGGGFTGLIDFNPGTASFYHCRLAYQIVNATTAINYQPVLSASEFGHSIIASFKGA